MDSGGSIRNFSLLSSNKSTHSVQWLNFLSSRNRMCGGKEKLCVLKCIGVNSIGKSNL